MVNFPPLFLWSQPFYDFALDTMGAVVQVGGTFVVDTLRPVIEGVSGIVVNVQSEILKAIPVGLGGVVEWIGLTGANLNTFIGEGFLNFQAGFYDAIETTQSVLGTGITTVTDWVIKFPSNVFDAVSPIIAGTQNFIGSAIADTQIAIGSGINIMGASLLEGFTTGLQTIIAPFQEFLAEIPGALLTGIGNVGTIFSTGLETILGGIINGVQQTLNPATLKPLFDGIGGFFGAIQQNIMGIIEPIMSTAMSPVGSPPDMILNYAIGLIGKLLIGASALSIPFIAGELVHPLKEMGLGQVSAMIFDVAGFRQYTAAIVGSITERTIAAPLRYAMNWIVHPYRPKIKDLQPFVWRGHMTEADYKQELRFDGVDTPYHEAMTDLLWKIPGPSDLVRFMVKEAITFEELPKYLEMQGYKKDWAAAYIQAHWLLPAVSQVYDMVARDVPIPTTLENYLKLADYHPDWRSSLLGIRYTLIPRVDLRYGYIVGAITDSDLVEKFKFLGYDDADAVLMTKIQKFRALTGERTAVRSQLEDHFETGLITESDLRESLKAMNYPSVLIELRIEASKMKVEREIIKDQIKLYLDAFKKDIVTESTLRTFLGNVLKNPEMIELLVQDALIKKGVGAS